MSEALKPCPFCGGGAAVNTTRTTDREFIRLNGRDKGFGVNCVVCGVDNLGITRMGKATEAEAIAAWNRRGSGVEKDDEGRPYQCGAFVSGDSRWECVRESDHSGDHEWRLPHRARMPTGRSKTNVEP